MSKPVDIERVKRSLARRHMADFAVYTDKSYDMNWHHRLLCDKLDKFITRDIRRLMVFMPPRHGKSELVSRKLPSFIFGYNPDASIIAASYSADLAQRMNRDIQRIIESERYAEVFPDTRLFGKNIRSLAQGTYLRNSDIFEIVGRRGVYRGAGVGGGITGMGADYIIIDDPIKNREEANSKTYRDRLWDWYTSTLYPRQEKNAAILVTLTRWHEDDLAGRLIEASKIRDGEKWEIIQLPAIRENSHCEYDTREIGDPLWPNKYNLQELIRTKATIGSYEWTALYQQRPSPLEGSLIKRSDFKFYDILPNDISQMAQSWDCTFKEADLGDFVAGHVWGRKGADYYLVDRVHRRMGIKDTMQAIITLSAKWPQARAKYVEEAANGAAVIELLKREVSGLIPVTPRGGKVARAQAIIPYIESGNVHLPGPKIAPWIHDFIEECANFPNGAHDDDVDAMTQGINQLASAPTYSPPPVDYGNQRKSYWR